MARRAARAAPRRAGPPSPTPPARAASSSTLRLAVALRALVRAAAGPRRRGRGRPARADRVGGRARSCRYGDYRIALPWVISPLVDALIERGELEEARALGRRSPGSRPTGRRMFGFTFLLDSLARLRLAQGRAPEALQPRARVRAPPARVGLPQPGLRRLRLDARRRAAPPPAARRRRSTPCDEQIDLRARFGVAREHGHGAARARRRSRATPRPLRAAEVLAGSEARARARPRAGRARRPRAAARGARARRALRRDRARRPAPATRWSRPARSRAARALTGAAALTAAQERVARLAAGRPRQPRDRRAAVRDREDRRGPPRRAPTASSASPRAANSPTRFEPIPRDAA